MVPGEQQALFAQRVAEVVGGVAGRMHRFHGPALAMDAFAIGQADVGHEVEVRAGLARWLHADARRAGRSVHRRAGALRQGTRQRRVVEVCVGHQDVGDGLAGQRCHQRVEVRRVIRPRIDHRHAAAPDHVGAGAVQGVGTGIARDDAPDQRGEGRELAVFEGQLALQRQGGGQGACRKMP